MDAPQELPASTEVQASAVPPSMLHSLRAAVEARSLLVWALFLFSGACGLIYEVLWCRQLGLIFGNTVHSISAVLTAFMGGLALGSYVSGRLCARLRRPLLAYGVLELLIGLYCSALPWLFSDSGPLVPFYRSLYGETGSASLSVARFAISFAALLIPTTFMGATLPILSQYLVKSSGTLGRTAGALYAVNSLGAVVGALAAGFLLLPELGKLQTNWVAVACNITLGALAIYFGRSEVAAPVTEPATPGASADAPAIGGPAPAVSPQGVKLAVLAFGVTGFAAMATQIGWTRAISLGTGSSTYAFSLIVAIFILGLSLGGMWGARAAPRARDPLALLGTILVLIGLFNMLVTVFLGISPIVFFLLIAWGSDSSWSALLAAQALGIALLIIIPTMLMGTTLPLTLQVASRSGGNAGRIVGTVYAVNTLGAILGSFLGGLALIPALQIQSMLELMALLYAVPGIILFAHSASRRATKRVLAAAIPAALLALTALFAGRWDPLVMSSGAYLLRSGQQEIAAAREGRLLDAIPNLRKDHKVLYHKEGAECTVAVIQFGDDISLRVGGKPDASSRGDMTTQITLTLVPEILHASRKDASASGAGPEEILVIGLGSGVSAGCATAMPSVKRVDVVEMSPEVIEASSKFSAYNKLNYSEGPPATINTPRVQALVNDGRNHLLLTSRRYDVIASEPSNPWMAGVGNLFTREAFALCRERLKPGGIMCQWLHSYSLEAAHVYSIVLTFGDVFPNMQLWHCNLGDYLLIGSQAKLDISAARLSVCLGQQGVKAWLERVHFDTPYEFLAGFQADDVMLRRRVKSPEAYVASGQRVLLHTDDNMLLEFEAPRSLYKTRRQFRATSFESIPELALDCSGLPAAERSEFQRSLDLAVAGREHFRNSGVGPAGAHKDQAFALAPHQLWAIEFQNQKEQAEANKLMLGSGAPDPAGAVKLLSQAQSRSKFARWDRLALNRMLADNAKRLIDAGDAGGALAELEKIDAPEHAHRTALLRARAMIARKEYDKAVAETITAAKLGGKPMECTVLAVEALSKSGRKTDAIATAHNLLRAPKARQDSTAAELWGKQAELLLEQKNLGEALGAVRIGLALAPNDPGMNRTEARVLAASGRWLEAVRSYRDYATADPENPQAKLEGVKVMLEAAGQPSVEPRPALEALHTARRISREVTVLHPELPEGWEWLCRCFLALEKADTPNAAFNREEAQSTFKTLKSLNKGEKIPADLKALLEPKTGLIRTQDGRQ